MDHNQTVNKSLTSSSLIDISTSESFQNQQDIQSNNDDAINPESKPVSAGTHFIIDFWGELHLRDVAIIEQSLRDAAKSAGALLLHIHIHKFADQGGVTGVALLAESHISVHTWPENNYAAFDVFMCGDAQPEKAIEILKQVFQPTKIEIKEIQRGKLSQE